MRLLVLGHVAQLIGNAHLGRDFAEHRQLTLINRHRSVFPGMIDTDHLGDAVGVGLAAGQRRAGRAAHLRLIPIKTEAAASPTDISAL